LKAEAEEDGDANGKLLEIAHIRLTEDPNAGEGDEEEVDDEGNAIRHDEEEDGGDDEKGESNRRKKQFNDKYELDKFLLYLIFAKSTNQAIRNLAVKVLVLNFN
jgi:hypothetical protein